MAEHSATTIRSITNKFTSRNFLFNSRLVRSKTFEIQSAILSEESDPVLITELQMKDADDFLSLTNTFQQSIRNFSVRVVLHGFMPSLKLVVLHSSFKTDFQVIL